MHRETALLLFVLSLLLHTNICAGGGPALVPIDPCDTSLQITLSYAVVDPYLVELVAVIDTGGYYSLQSLTWGFDDGQSIYNGTTQQLHQFPGPGNYLACLTVNAIGPDQIMCARTTCLPITLLGSSSLYSSCDSAYLDFTAVYANGYFTFSLVDPGTNYFDLIWDLGDGTSANGATVDHPYAGTGPYLVCLSADLVDPFTLDTCALQVCHWLYAGPDSIPCSQVLDVDFDWASYGNFVAFFNTSVTSGSPSSLFWDLGDGTTSASPLFVHEYAVQDAYQVCLTVAAWGALAQDTCSATLCRTVPLGATAWVSERYDEVHLHAYPVPCRDEMQVEIPNELVGGRLRLLDLQGRCVSEWHPLGGALFRLDMSDVPPGTYVLEGLGHRGRRSVRVVRE
ncbi:MAG: hypothetical protein H6594_00235 [Flavobacteriales bacterium]|nr:hypothetical protein [Flavobacteriales bacterium]